jgi:hypothetical protein
MKINIPSEYQPFEKLIICSNVLIGTGAFFKVGEIEPLLIGKGLNLPTIWLRARANKNNWIPVVERSIILSQQLEIINDIVTNTTTIKMKDIVIIQAQQKKIECIINKLDLRPLGLNIFGDENLLEVGAGKFKGNTMKGGGAFFGFNE